MKSLICSLAILSVTLGGYSQSINLTFSGYGEISSIDSITATNLNTLESLTFPGESTLVLDQASDVNYFLSNSLTAKIYPNPFPGETSLELLSDEFVPVRISVHNYIGQEIAEYNGDIMPGSHKFSVTLNKPGLYILSAAMGDLQFNQRIINNESSRYPNVIEYKGYGSMIDSENGEKTIMSEQNLYNLGYQAGDVVLFRCRGGEHTSIFTDTPWESKTYDIEFVRCEDLDGKNYPVVKVGEQIWMADNLAYLPQVNPPSDESASDPRYYVYGYDGYNIADAKANENYEKYGILYNWQAANISCPDAWHLASDDEWRYLELYLGMDEEESGARGDRASGSVDVLLKSNSGWTDNNGNNFSGFNVKPAGFRNLDGTFMQIEESWDSWTSTINPYPWFRGMAFNRDGVLRTRANARFGISARCLYGYVTQNRPYVLTGEVSNITETTAECSGEVTEDGNTGVDRRGICWNLTGAPTLSDNYTENGSGLGAYTGIMTGLNPNTTYYVRAYARNKFGASYSTTIEITTDHGVGLPSVMTTHILNVTDNSALGGGEVTDDGGSEVHARGICYNTGGNPDLNDIFTVNGSGLGTFQSSLSGLTENTTYYVRAYAINSEGTVYGEQKQFTTEDKAGAPTILTLNVTNITENTAECGGEVTDDGGANVTSRGVCWNLTGNPTVNVNYTNDGSGTGEFVSSLTSLSENTTYYVRAYATNNEGTSYGSQKQFTTDQSAGLPTVSTENVSNINETNAESGGDVTEDGGATVTLRGVCWNTNGNPTISDSKTSNGSGTGSFSSYLSGLDENTSYYVRAYATNSEGTAYGEQKQFKTDKSTSPATVITADVSNIDETSADCGGNVTNDGGASVTARGVCWNLTGNPNINDDKTTDGSGVGNFSSRLTGLGENTTYYVRAYVTNSEGTAYGEEKQFTTEQAAGLPSVTTTEVTNISVTSSDCGGIVTDDGGASVTARGVCWNTSGNPTIGDSHTSDGSGIGAFNSNLTGLADNQVYFVRSYATNSEGTAYGEQKQFSTDQSAITPTVVTSDVTNIGETSADCGGNVLGDGGASVSSRGICWNTHGNPTVNDNKSSDGSGTGQFTSNLTGLSDNTTYYVRAYATNKEGTAYGNQRQFTTSNSNTGTFTDSRDGTEYDWVIIGDQKWMAENLKYLPSVNEIGDWTPFEPKHYVYNYSGTQVADAKAHTNYSIYGVLYNYDAAKTSCPQGWHLPKKPEFDELNAYLSENQAYKLKSESGWNSNGNGDNSSGFNALPAGITDYDDFEGLGYKTSFGTSLSEDGDETRSYYLDFDQSNFYWEVQSAGSGNSVRCLFGDPVYNKPQVWTASVEEVTSTTALIKIKVDSDGGTRLTYRGVCWGLSENPTIEDNAIMDSYSLRGYFTVEITGLEPNTVYYCQGFANNSAGIGYGGDKQFTTTGGNTGTFTDSRDGNDYNWIIIGDQTWMAENLKYLPEVNSTNDYSQKEPKYYVYDYSGTKVSEAKGTGNYQTYGVLYNWQSSRISCPEGWKLPDRIEMNTLKNYLGEDPGYKMKSVTGWSNEGNGDNSSGFNAIPAGENYGGGFGSLNRVTFFWSSYVSRNEWSFDFYYGKIEDEFSEFLITSKIDNFYGYSVRCIQGDPYYTVPTVTTKDITDIGLNFAKSGGEITNDGGTWVQEQGIYWNTTGNPAVGDNVVNNPNNFRSYVSEISGLEEETSYYVRAFARNSEGIGYGEEKSFTTLASSGTFIDSRDGTSYDWMFIGNQVWMTENLAWLPNVHQPSSGSTSENRFYVYDYNGTDVSAAKTNSNYGKYGVLYNWTAAGIACPDGWRLPTDQEIKLLEYNLGMSQAHLDNTDWRISGDVGDKLKNSTGWDSGGNGNNSSGLTFKPGGGRYTDGTFKFEGKNAAFWSSDNSGSANAWGRGLAYDNSGVYRAADSKANGFSVRCVRE